RRAVVRQRQLDALDRALDAGAVPAGRREEDPLDGRLLHGFDRSLRRPEAPDHDAGKTEGAPDRSGGSVRPDALSSAPRGLQGQVRAAAVRIAQYQDGTPPLDR